MNFKKIASLILVAVLCLSLFACGKNKNKNNETTPTPETTLTPDSTPESTPNPESPLDPEAGEQLSASMKELIAALEQLQTEIEAPDSKDVEEIASDIREAIQTAIAFELTDEVRTAIALGALDGIRQALTDEGIDAEAVSAFVYEITYMVKEAYTIEFTPETVEELLTNTQGFIVEVLVSEGADEEQAAAYASAQINALLAYFDPADPAAAKAALAETLASLKAEILANPEFPTQEDVLAIISQYETAIVKILNGEITDEEALAAFTTAENLAYAFLETKCGITKEDAAESIANIRALLTELLNATVEKAEIDAAFEEVRAAIDLVKDELLASIGEGKDGLYSVTGILAALYAAGYDDTFDGSAIDTAAVEAQIKEYIQQIIDFELTDEVRVEMARAYLAEVKTSLIDAGLTTEALDTLFTEINTLVDQIYTTEINAALVNSFINQLRAELINLYVSEIGGTEEDAALYADAQISAILALFDPQDPEAAVNVIVSLLVEVKASVIESGYTAEAIKTALATVKELADKVLSDGFTDEELIGYVKAYEDSIYAALEAEGITAEDIAEAREELNATLEMLLTAGVSAENIDDVFAAIHEVVDTVEVAFYAIAGADSNGSYNLIDLCSSYIAVFVSSYTDNVEKMPVVSGGASAA